MSNVDKCDQVSIGTVIACQIQIGESEWKEVVEELQDIEKRGEPEKKVETDVE